MSTASAAVDFFASRGGRRIARFFSNSAAADEALVDEFAQGAHRGRAVELAIGQRDHPEHVEEIDFGRAPPVFVADVDLVLRRNLRRVRPFLQRHRVDGAVDGVVGAFLDPPQHRQLAVYFDEFAHLGSGLRDEQPLPHL
jgi:hypothetical protein